MTVIASAGVADDRRCEFRSGSGGETGEVSGSKNTG